LAAGFDEVEGRYEGVGWAAGDDALVRGEWGVSRECWLWGKEGGCGRAYTEHACCEVFGRVGLDLAEGTVVGGWGDGGGF
jgi:hypothetical protein